MRRLFVLLALVSLGACDEPSPPPGELLFELGTGEVGFEPLSDEQELELVAGPQGGHHVWVSLRVENLGADHVLMDLDAVPLTAGEPPPRRLPVRLLMTDQGGEHLYIGWPAQLDDAACFVDVRTSLRVTVTTPDGRTASEERVIVPQEREGGDPLLGTCE